MVSTISHPSPRRGSPRNEQLTEGFVVGYFPFYSLAVFGVYVLRKREPSLPRPFRVPLYPVTPLVFLAGAGALLWGAIRELGATAALSFVVMALGLPVGMLWQRMQRSAPIRKNNETVSDRTV